MAFYINAHKSMRIVDHTGQPLGNTRWEKGAGMVPDIGEVVGVEPPARENSGSSPCSLEFPNNMVDSGLEGPERSSVSFVGGQGGPFKDREEGGTVDNK